MIGKWCGAIVFALCLDGQATAQESAVACPSAKVAVVSVSREIGDAADARPAIEILKGSTNDSHTVLIRGPVFGSMDAPDVRASVACNASGIGLTETIVRSDQFYGAAGKNVPWRPIVKLIVMLKAASAELTVKWDVRLSNGNPFDSAHAARAGEHYPVVASQTIHR